MSRSLQRALQVASDSIVKQEAQIQRALQVLQRAQRYELVSRVIGATVVESSSGDYVEITDVNAAIDILQEGQQ